MVKEIHTIVIVNWSFIYCILCSVTKDQITFQDFQYKVRHIILITNSFLYKRGLIQY